MAVTHGGDVFAIAREHGWDWRDALDFSANINPLGPSPRVKPAICGAIDRIVHYPERDSARLRKALACVWNVGEEQLLPGNGATELIFFLARMFRSAPVTLAVPVFSEFHRAFPNCRTVNLTDPAQWPREGLLVITRPANPTGWTVPLGTLQGWLEASKAVVLVDESFIEFSSSPSAIGLLDRYPQLIVLRSLTKVHALPGLRIGALAASRETVRRWKEEREPWQVNVLAEEAALAALGDREHVARSVDFVRSERGWLFRQLLALPGAEPQPGEANFLFVRLKYPARILCEHLLRYKILVRNCADWPGVRGDAVRIAVRPRHENERLLHAWRECSCA